MTILGEELIPKLQRLDAVLGESDVVTQQKLIELTGRAPCAQAND